MFFFNTFVIRIYVSFIIITVTMINTQNKACPETSTFLPFFVRITKVLPSTNQRHMGSSFAAFKVENNQTFGWFQIVDGACKIVQTFYFCFFF